MATKDANKKKTVKTVNLADKLKDKKAAESNETGAEVEKKSKEKATGGKATEEKVGAKGAKKKRTGKGKEKGEKATAKAKAKRKRTKTVISQFRLGNTTDIIEAMTFAAKAITATMDEMSNFLFRGSNGSLTITGTSIDVSAISKVNYIDRAEFEFSVSSQLILKTIKLCKGSVKFLVYKERLEIHNKKGQFELPLGVVDSFPTVATLGKPKLDIEVDKTFFEKFKVASTFVSSISGDIKSGVYLCASENTLSIVATDGSIMMYDQIALAEEASKDSCFTSKTTINKFGFTNARLKFDGKDMSVSTSKNEVILKALTDQYPEYQRVIPSESAVSQIITVHREVLLAAVDKMLVFAPEANYEGVFKFEDGKLHLSTEDKDFDKSASTKLRVELSEDKDVKFSTDLKRAKNVLASMKAEEITMKYHSPTKAILISQGSENRLMMPMKPKK